MAQSLSQINVHLIFSTKYRKEQIKSETESELFAYMGATINRLGGNPFIINGTADHVHLFSTLPRTIALAKFIEEIKKTSSKWIKTKDNCYNQFGWQEGYAAFSVSSSKKNDVIKYIKNQKEHHKKESFQDELLMFLNEYGIAFDEKYLWN